VKARRTSGSLLWRILLSTSAALTLLFAATGWIVQNRAERIALRSLEEEVRSGFQAYEALWRSRAEMLATVSRLLSRMPDVRAAFSTRDRATIRDTADEIWGRIGSEGAIFLVTDPQGEVIASLGGAQRPAPAVLPAVKVAAERFPNQASGFLVLDQSLFQVTVTPVYVESPRAPVLLNVLVAGYKVDDDLARRLLLETGGSEFAFVVGGRVVAASLRGEALYSAGQMPRVTHPLLDLEGKPIGELRIGRSLDAARAHLANLRRDILFIWAAAMLAGLVLTWVLARRILEPVAELDRAAARIAQGDYEFSVPVRSQDELGRLAESFNAMSASIREARQELIRQERISTIARLSTSLVHDLRNPLAAIFGGAEMLVDSQLSSQQVKRLAGNIYKSSRRIQELLQELLDLGRQAAAHREICRVADLVRTAVEAHAGALAKLQIELEIALPESLEVEVDRSRIERLFENLIGNSIDAMPGGGLIRVSAGVENRWVMIQVADNGPGVAPEIADRLFQPFVTARKHGGLGLGLAFARQTALDHGGDLWLDRSWAQGACFCLRLPRAGGN